jgi:hypothetical protein
MKLSTQMKQVIRGACVALLAAFVVAFGAPARAAANATMDEANRAFGEARYGEASADFEALVRQEGYSAPLLFDLGNAYLRDGKPVPAMLAYERAELLAPRDPGIQANLAVARAAATATDDSGPVSRIAHLVPTNAWTWLAAAGFWVMAGTFAAAMLWKRHRASFVSVAAGAAMAVAGASAALIVGAADLDRGLVMVPAPVFVSPFATAQSDFALPAGSSITLGPARDGYVFIRDATGRSGWLERSQVEPVIPRPS